MAQPKLEYITLAVSKKIGDEVDTASADGELKSSLQRIDAINNARSLIYNELYNQIKAEKFAEQYREFLKESAGIDIEDNKGDKPANVKYICGMVFVIDPETDFADSQTTVYEPKKIDPDVYYEAKYDTYSSFKADANNLLFTDTNSELEILGITVADGTAKIMYLEDSVPVVLDIPSIAISGITKANPMVITVPTGHGLEMGDIIDVSGVVGMIQVNGQTYTITEVGTTTITIGAVNSTAYTTYVSGGVITKWTADIPDPYSWQPKIIEVATKILLTDLQIYN